MKGAESENLGQQEVHEPNEKRQRAASGRRNDSDRGGAIADKPGAKPAGDSPLFPPARAETDGKKPLSGEDISPSFCILPWIHLSTRPNGHLRLCCAANASSAGPSNDKKFKGEAGILKKDDDGRPANFNHTDLKTAYNSLYMRTVRKQMLNGQKPYPCLKCFKEEDGGYQSKRMWETRLWSKRVDLKRLVKETGEDGSVPVRLLYMDLRFGVKCNLKCIMCSPHDSSLWVRDWNKLFPQIQNPSLKELMNWPDKGRRDGGSYNWASKNKRFREQLDEQLPYIQQLYFAGGESVIIDEHYALLEKCVKEGRAENIELRYNSNGVKLPPRLFELWSRFKRVIFHFSLDGIEERNDYIRFPSRFEHIVRQLKRLDAETPDSVIVTLSCAVSALNIYSLPDFIEWKLSMSFRKINQWPKSAGLIDTHLVYHPAHLNVKVLPQALKDRTEEKFEAFYSRLKDHFRRNPPPRPQALEPPQKPRADGGFAGHPYGIQRLKGLVRFMQSEDWSRRLPELKEYLVKMDKIRKTDFAGTFPELRSLVQ